ncbi:Calmodulin protein 1 [Phytophthora cinnamomi]|uniref:Calmodulin protein 1 n=1 Tax=Phytophthora cinnamomi TaxID=4785 RepID=UPI00355A6F30|nr:Calmodulin protein 1 [Phytophthora cinnamomi]
MDKKSLEPAAEVLPPDSAAKLLRVFCFLRQHERKARIARKTAELNAWRGPPSPPSACTAEDELQQASQTEELDKKELVVELNLLAAGEEPDGPASTANRSKSGGTGGRNAAAAIANASASTVQELRREIKELQKGVVTNSNDTTGVITAADLASCMKSLNRVPSKGEVQWMIWEVDNDLDGCVSWEEFKGCYVRTLLDSHGLELNQLYYLIQFLLCDTDGSQTVSADEITAELQRIGGTEHLTVKLWSVLDGESEEQQFLRKLTLSEFLEATLADLPTSFSLH